MREHKEEPLSGAGPGREREKAEAKAARLRQGSLRASPGPWELCRTSVSIGRPLDTKMCGEPDGAQGTCDLMLMSCWFPGL